MARSTRGLGKVDRIVINAQDNVDLARAQVIATLTEMRHRISPRTLAGEALSALNDHVTQTLETTVLAAKSRPWLVGLVVAVIGLMAAARLRGTNRSSDETNHADDRSSTTGDHEP